MLPQFGLTEFLVIAIVALIVVGPKDLPTMMRRIGQFVAKGRAMANEFRLAFDDIAKQTELEELKAEIDSLKRENSVTQAMDDLKAVEQDINANVMAKEADQSAQSEQLTDTGKAESDPDER
ncbi:MAG: Sec-independent protein translocase protein TatB [Pseudomonadota bacterium]